MAVVGILSLLLVVSVGLVSALPRGAPPGACMSLTPGHGSTPIDPSVRPPLYFVVTDLMMDNGTLVYEPDQTYNSKPFINKIFTPPLHRHAEFRVRLSL